LRAAGRPPAYRLVAMILAGLVVLAVGAWSIARTGPTRRSVRAYTDLIAAANAQDVDRARALCSARYLAARPIEAAGEGGLVGLPRNIHKNFQVWREGPDVWLCPTNRVGPIYRFIHEGDGWKFDGPIGILKSQGRIVRSADGAGVEVDPGEAGPPPG